MKSQQSGAYGKAVQVTSETSFWPAFLSPNAFRFRSAIIESLRQMAFQHCSVRLAGVHVARTPPPTKPMSSALPSGANSTPTTTQAES